ncbi:MAG: sigma-54-dependent Fis family transcriptional regulator [Candidatus Rokubacteria bacterium]|nr:sigma-54-dependent Fis family transcriptional regulator [Candidatus Rokubacteria bacterium]MBI3105469.1 sigma-54-dependent Fis family transcriptional regulator [Candidatus Rokubacteria bacterium]
MAHRILVADDQEASRKGLSALLQAWGYEPEEAADGQEALDKAVASRPAVVITDLVMPKLDGLALLKALQAEVPFAMVIILTGHGTIETAVGATKDGAYDYLTKPVDTNRLRLLIQKALEKGAALREVSVLRRRVKDVWGHGRLVGTSRAMQEVYRLIDLAAPTSAPVLIFGESGTGKELAARTLHELGPRHDGPFVAVNCAAIPETLLESEIFGHEKGAFTGALERRVGCFELAHQGTIFLDEIGEMSPSLQAKFLRILEDGSVKRVGGKAEIRVDVRVLAATNKDPAKAIQDGKFREDLYYRLNVFAIPLPPLRDRKEDIPLLIQAFLEEFDAKYDRKVRGVDDAALSVLTAHDWPGNVRELRNIVERALIACPGELIAAAHLPAGLGERPAREPEPAGAVPPAAGPGGEVPAGVRLRDLEREAILKTLAAVNNNKTRAAQLLGISLKTLHNKLNRYGP